jgi:hypothetical protein
MTSCVDNPCVQTACCQTRAWLIYGAVAMACALTVMALGILGEMHKLHFLTPDQFKYFTHVGGAVLGVGIAGAIAALSYRSLCIASPPFKPVQT